MNWLNLNRIQERVTSWVHEGTMINLALLGKSLDASIYDNLDPALTKTPSNLLGAYKQACYFTAIAARRADSLDNGVANSVLLAHLKVLLAHAEALEKRSSAFWTTRSGMVQVLRDTARVISVSGLTAGESFRISAILLKTARAVSIRKTLVYAGIAGASLFALRGYLLHRRS